MEPRERRHVPCGRVLFTASVERYSEAAEPSAASVALRISAITLGSIGVAASGGLLAGLAIGAGVTAAAVSSAVTSVKGVKEDGVFADGKVLIVQQILLDHELQLVLQATYEVNDDGDNI